MSLGNKMLNGLAWSAIERIAIQAIQFFLGIILARILLPEEYGVFAILMIFISISQVFIESGFTKALINKVDRTQIDISTVYFFNIFVSVLCFVLIYFISPWIGEFYETPTLVSLLRVAAISLIINALYTVSTTLVTIELNFKLLAKVNFIATVLSGSLAIYLAYNGYGVWSLVYQTLARSIITCVSMWVAVKWKPLLVFSKQSFKELFSYGSKLLISSLLNKTFNQINSILIGKYIGVKDLGFYSRGVQFADFPFNILTSSLNNVLLPSLSAIQKDLNLLRSYFKTIIKMTALVTVPIFFGLIVIADPLIRFLLTDKWAMCIPIMQIFCLSRLISTISGINVNLLHIIGRTDLSLKQEYIKIIVRIALLLIAVPFGIYYIALAELVSTSIHFFINSYSPGKIMKYGAINQLKDLLPIIFSGILMSILLFSAVYYIENTLLKLIISPFIIISTFYGSAYLLKVKEINTLISKVKNLNKNAK
ncbi:lipopolysaccharide biosynthesis protein [Cellulophaga sp. HaHaR_3_176]|uniref:lipopolysaccharide biosynthesis protein n=1 Tax=Cellulophaga sp. HaHaR_3_176 TaxID=1942464 RepID=UPI001C1F3F72|nr:lipopolysaccharide biosynthesis protein [Cellulophaga sp. HaHaR_3_176]QWX84802.1 lipopolysaccharide biosynthesis protein [Cellulophaga sp. HaHaR_3_176]